MRVRTHEKVCGGVTYKCTIENRDDDGLKILFMIIVNAAEPIPIAEWSTLGALCELFRKEIAESQ